MIEQTIEKLKSLRCSTFAKALSAQMESSHYGALSFEERLSLLVEEEFLARENRRLVRNLKEAKLKQDCAIEDVNFEHSRNLKRSLFMELAACHWIKKKHNLIITGPTGVGKSFLACALADKACKLKFHARYTKASEFARELLISREDGSYHRFMTKMSKTHLLLIDEWLRDPLSQEQAREILDLLDDRFRKNSTIFISQLPVKDWHQHIGDPTLADAILDRVIHDSHRMELTGESMRKKTARVATYTKLTDCNSGKGESSLRSD
jgi:DNA replication protein DnaC